MSDKLSLATLNGQCLIVGSNGTKTKRRGRTAQAVFTTAPADTDRFQLDDAVGNAVVYHYIDGGVSPGDADRVILITITPVATAADKARLTAIAISEGPGNFFAISSGATITVSLYNTEKDVPGSIALVTNGTGSPLTISQQFTADTNPLPIETASPGLPAPTIKPGISKTSGGNDVLTGEYTFIPVYYDAESNHESPKSVVVDPLDISGSPFATEDALIDFSPMSGDIPADATHIRLYRSLGQTAGVIPQQYFLIAQVAINRADTFDVGGTVGDFLDDKSDPVATAENFTLDPEIQGVPDLEIVTALNGRLWGAAGPNVFVSDPNNPNNFSPLATFPIGENITDVKAMLGQNENMIIYKKTEVHVFDYNHNPVNDARIDSSFRHRGCLNFKCVAEQDGQHFIMDTKGIYMYESLVAIEELSGPIQEFLDRRNMAVQDTFHVIATDDRVRFFIALDEDTQPHNALVLDLRAWRATGKARWWPEFYDHAVVDSGLFQFGSSAGAQLVSDTLQACIIDDKANIYVLDYLIGDGVPSPLVCKGTVSTNTTTLVNITVGADGRGFQVATDYTYDALGLIIRFIDSDGLVSEAHQITAVTDNDTVTAVPLSGGTMIAGAFDGQTFFLGSIETIYESPQLSFEGPMIRKATKDTFISITPSPFDFTVHFTQERDRRGGDYMAATTAEGFYDTTSDEEGHELHWGHEVDDTQDGLSSERGIIRVGGCSESFHYLQWRLNGREPCRPYIVNEVDHDIINLELEGA